MEPDSEDRFGSLPVVLDEPFVTWSYSASHPTLVLRNVRHGAGRTVEVVFLDVKAMKLATSYQRLRIDEATDTSELSRLVDLDRMQSHGYRALAVSDGSKDGFVACGRLLIRHS